MFDRYEQIPFPVNFYDVHPDTGDKTTVGRFNVTIAFSSGMGDLKEANLLCGAYCSVATLCPCRLCQRRNTELWKAYDPSELRSINALHTLWKVRSDM